MNANELADKLSQFGEGAVFANVKLIDVATMLRQQQAEIEALKKRTSLTDEKIQAVYKAVYGDIIVPATRKTFEFARAIERAHGIGE